MELMLNSKIIQKILLFTSRELVCNFQIAQLLKEHGANIDAINGEGSTILHYAALHCSDIQFNKSINKRDVLDKTPLHNAKRRSKIKQISNSDIINLSIKHGAKK